MLFTLKNWHDSDMFAWLQVFTSAGTCLFVEWVQLWAVIQRCRNALNWEGAFVLVNVVNTVVLGPVVQKPANANLGLKINQRFCFSC